MKLFSCRELESSHQSAWRQKAFDSFSQMLADREKVFPCTFGVAGFKSDHLRFAFVDESPASPPAIDIAAAALQSYLPVARTAGCNTSLVLFFSESADLGEDAYRKIFWSTLDGIRKLDSKPWPTEIPLDPENDSWEFSFFGEAVFVVCNTPSHKKRKSRFGSVFTLTFQPRWVFDGIVGPSAPNGTAVKNQIRDRLSKYDTVPASIHLGEFGASGNREWKQYFLSDESDVSDKVDVSCPMASTSNCAVPWVVVTDASDLHTVVSRLLPPTGSVEVQVDTPHRIHPAHSHDTDETLHIVSGSIVFHVGERKIECNAGDRLMLPARTRHASEAGDQGCMYVIATRFVHDLPARQNALELQ